MSENQAEPAKSGTISEEETRFTEEMRESRITGRAAEAVLRTDDRVLARITDGIYRQPSSALRELISNAYDADATEVYIDTDAPRFSKIEIRDNGAGMDEDALSRLIHHIGGSSKRTTIGAQIGTTDPSNPNLSPSGRRLIGKIGIGLFSVSQLTSHFQIITKVKGRDYRLFADVILKTYSEQEDSEAPDGKFETGRVRVVTVPAEDTESQGTQIILRQLHPRARNILRSQERWDRVVEQEDLPESERDPLVSAPIYHAGLLEKEPAPEDQEFLYRRSPVMPWSRQDTPEEKFSKLYNAVADQVGTASERPELSRVLDAYLSTLWTLSLSAPLRYLEKHPFDLDTGDGVTPYRLTNARGRAPAVELQPGESIRRALNLSAGSTDALGEFKVFIDEIELRRPITFKWWPSERQALDHPLIFVGSYAPDLSKIPARFRGGDLEFEAYLFWNSKIVPKENNGVLIRINGASGALFDDSFMKYQVSEQTRLRQITAEVFVKKGLDPALNIDRESFNFSHPHYVILSNWLHRSLRQLANTHKGLNDELRAKEAQAEGAEQADRLTRFVNETWHSARRTSTDRPPPVEVVETASAAVARRQQGVIALDRSKIGATAAPAGRKRKQDQSDREQKIRAVATILDGFGILENMDYEDQHRLLDAILSVFYEDAR
jgi:hypothetical protein